MTDGEKDEKKIFIFSLHIYEIFVIDFCNANNFDRHWATCTNFYANSSKQTKYSRNSTCFFCLIVWIPFFMCLIIYFFFLTVNYFFFVFSLVHCIENQRFFFLLSAYFLTLCIRFTLKFGFQNSWKIAKSAWLSFAKFFFIKIPRSYLAKSPYRFGIFFCSISKR